MSTNAAPGLPADAPGDSPSADPLPEAVAFPYATAVIAVGGLLVAVALVTAMFTITNFGPTPVAAEGLSPDQKLQKVQSEGRGQAAGYCWVQKPAGDKAGVVAVPVERAADVILAEQGPKP